MESKNSFRLDSDQVDSKGVGSGSNYGHLGEERGFVSRSTPLQFLWNRRWIIALTVVACVTAFGLFAVICVSQSGSLFSADSWHDITFAGGEVKDPRRTLPRALRHGEHRFQPSE